MDTTEVQAVRYPIAFSAQATPDTARLAKWRALWHVLLASPADTSTLAVGERPTASKAEGISVSSETRDT